MIPCGKERCQHKANNWSVKEASWLDFRNRLNIESRRTCCCCKMRKQGSLQFRQEATILICWHLAARQAPRVPSFNLPCKSMSRKSPCHSRSPSPSSSSPNQSRWVGLRRCPTVTIGLVSSRQKWFNFPTRTYPYNN